MAKERYVWVETRQWHKGKVVSRGPQRIPKRNLGLYNFEPVEERFDNQWQAVVSGWRYRAFWSFHSKRFATRISKRWKALNKWVDLPVIKPIYSNVVALAVGGAIGYFAGSGLLKRAWHLLTTDQVQNEKH